MVEYKLPKLGVAGSNPVARSMKAFKKFRIPFLRLLAMGRIMVDLLRIVGIMFLGKLQ